jgi:hypothetical protein
LGFWGIFLMKPSWKTNSCGPNTWTTIF